MQSTWATKLSEVACGSTNDCWEHRAALKFNQSKGVRTFHILGCLQCSSSEEEREHRRGVNQRMATYASSVDMEDLQTMVAQGHAAQRDPYNKMHERNLESWSDEEEEPSRPVRLHTGDQLPRRRKKKNKDKRGRQVCVNEDEMMARAWETMMNTTRNLNAASSSMQRMPQSGLRSTAQDPSSLRIPSRSGLHGTAELHSSQSSSRSGLHGAMNESSSPNIPLRSGSHAAAAGTSTMRMPDTIGLW